MGRKQNSGVHNEINLSLNSGDGSGDGSPFPNSSSRMDPSLKVGLLAVPLIVAILGYMGVRYSADQAKASSVKQSVSTEATTKANPSPSEQRSLRAKADTSPSRQNASAQLSGKVQGYHPHGIPQVELEHKMLGLISQYRRGFAGVKRGASPMDLKELPHYQQGIALLQEISVLARKLDDEQTWEQFLVPNGYPHFNEDEDSGLILQSPRKSKIRAN